MKTEATVTLPYQEFQNIQDELDKLRELENIKEREHKALCRALIWYREHPASPFFQVLMREYGAEDIELDTNMIQTLGTSRDLDGLFKK